MIKLHLDPEIISPARKIEHQDRILLVGSCFTEHIGEELEVRKFQVLQNPNGIIFDPLSVASSLVSYIDGVVFREEDLFKLGEIWNHWGFHSRYGGLNKTQVLESMNRAIEKAHLFLKTADWLIITLGTAFSYQLVENAAPVANCHRAPSNWFNKNLLKIEEINAAMDNAFHQLKVFNPNLRLIVTVSPVRHIRDGLVNNNRSKARLIESVHQLAEKFEHIYYFPSYELVIDVLRDHRFFDIDLVHPNYQATSYVLDQFSEHFMSGDARQLSAEMKKIDIARKHKPFHAASNAHAKFLQEYSMRVKALRERYPYMDLEKELAYFSGTEQT